MLEELKERVYLANLELQKKNLVTLTWGNVSGIDREKGYIVIKPSGVEYDVMRPSDMVVLNLDGSKIEGSLNPSSDTKTHVMLYQAFPQLGGIVHTHSPYAVGWAQAGEDIPCYGTTHADYFYGSVPCTRLLTKAEMDADYETNTGKIIVEEFVHRHLNPDAIPAVICHSHGPFTWGDNPEKAVYHAVVLEEIAKIAIYTRQIRADVPTAPQSLMDKHYYRKHGPNAYYGQK